MLRERAVLAMELAADLQAKSLLPRSFLKQLGRPPCLADITSALAGQLRPTGHLVQGGQALSRRAAESQRTVESMGPPEALLPIHIFD